MSIFASMYGAGVFVRNALYDRRIFRIHRLQGPVVSVGNISVGGSGKTPFIILLGSLLKAKGIKLDVLSRGYGRSSRGILQVDPQGQPQTYGDEPLLIARQLEVPVIVGASRYEAGLFAERKFGPQLHLLDDGFQHRALARDFDIVLLSTDDSKDSLLPIGRLREPLTALDRADAIVLPDGEDPPHPFHEEQLIWKVRRGIRVQNTPAYPLAFCGIARPTRFFAQLRSLGIDLAGEVTFRDHHRYNISDIHALQKLRKERQADGFITTEKDIINLGPLRLDLEPISVADVTLELDDAANTISTMLQRISTRAPGHEKILLTS